LQAELVEVDQRNLTERFDQIELDKDLLGLSRFFFPNGFFERQESVRDKPCEVNGPIIHDSSR
jgi:hypothetical protein